MIPNFLRTKDIAKLSAPERTYLQELYSLANIVHITADTFEKTIDILLYLLSRFIHESFMDGFDPYSLLYIIVLSKL